MVLVSTNILCSSKTLWHAFDCHFSLEPSKQQRYVGATQRHLYRKPDKSDSVGATCATERGSLAFHFSRCVLRCCTDYSVRRQPTCLAPAWVMETKAFREFCHSNFYGSSVILEQVSDHSWLGFKIDARQRTAVFKLPCAVWQLRHPRSAGSWRIRSSGFASRKALILKYAWPPESRQTQLSALRRLYKEAGFPATVLY